MATYDEQIITILARAGERGMSVKKISMQLYNLNCTLFSSPDFKDIHKYVQLFLMRNSKTPQSLFCKGEWGIYRLNPNSAQRQQLVINFADESLTHEEDAEQEKRNDSPDLSLNLFDQFF